MPVYTKEITFSAKDSTEAAAVTEAIKSILDSIEDKTHLIELGRIVKRKPGLIKQGIPYLKFL